jgi:hypothetical protein
LSEDSASMKKFYGHRRTLDLDRFFIAALDRYKAATGYGDTYAIFNILNEYLYEHGFMDKEAYEYHKKKYGVTLVEEAKRMLQMEEEAQKKAELQQQKPLDSLQKTKLFPDDRRPAFRRIFVCTENPTLQQFSLSNLQQ